MTLPGLSLAYLRDRALNTALNIMLLALAVATMVILVLFSAQLQGRFARDAAGIDLVVGAKGSPLQLILSGIYHVDIPTGNIPLATLDMLRRDPTVRTAIPLALGDTFNGFRIVGSEVSYPAHYGATVESGRLWSAPQEATLGAGVARATGAKVGQQFVGSHGLGGGEGAQEHDERPFVVVGVLAPTGTVLDRLILTSVESVWDVHGIAHEGEDHEGEEHHEGETEHEGEGHHEGEEHAAAPSSAAMPASVGPAEATGPEVTAILVSYRSSLAAIRLPRFINSQTSLQAAVPALEVTRLLSLVGVGLDAMRALAVLLLLSGGLSIFVALYTALRQREGDMAMLRVIGSTRGAIFGQVLSEGLLLAAAGAALGLILGHAVVALAAASFDRLGEMGLTAWHFEPAEGLIVLAALGIGAVAALLPALRVFQVDVADTLARAQ